MAHFEAVADEPIPTAELFLDERGSLLRVRWDDDRRELVVSLWRNGTCVGTHRLRGADTERLAALVAHLRIDA